MAVRQPRQVWLRRPLDLGGPDSELLSADCFASDEACYREQAQRDATATSAKLGANPTLSRNCESPRGKPGRLTLR